MEQNEKNAAVPAQSVQAPQAQAQKQEIRFDGKDRVLVLLVWLLGAFFIHLLMSVWTDGELHGLPALGMALFVAACYGVLFWYAGTRQAFTRRNLPLLIAQGLLICCLALYSDHWMRLLNYLAICVLASVQLFQQTGLAKHVWTRAAVLGESIALAIRGLFGGIDLPFRAIGSLRKVKHRKAVSVLLGLVVSALLLAVVLPLLLSADAVFETLLRGLTAFLRQCFSSLAARLFWGALLGIFLYSLYYFLRNGEHNRQVAEARAKAEAAAAEKAKTKTALLTDAVAPTVVLAVMDVLYLFFLLIQSLALFGGERYLAQAGVTYAQYARSGFFQLTAVAAVNLTVLLVALRLCGGKGKPVKTAGTILMGESAVMLISAACRMTLYVSVYGLSWLRVLTYWLMVMMAVLLAAGVLTVWKKRFRFFPVLFTVCLYGWVALNFLNVDARIAGYNVGHYLAGELTAVDVTYLESLSSATLPALERLPRDMVVETYQFYDADGVERYRTRTVSDVIESKRAFAAKESSHWEQWNLSDALAAGSGT